MITDKDIDLLEICEKLKHVKGCMINEESFYFHLWHGASNGTLIPCASYEEKKMTGCMVMSLSKDLKSTILTLIFIWIDKDCPELWKEYLEFASEMARKLGASKLQINTSRNPKAIERRLGKYGFSQKYVIFEKDVK